MKKEVVIAIVLITISAFLFGFGYQKNSEPRAYYQVYLDNEVLGVINSKEQLDKYIDKKGDEYKKKLGVNKIYAPNGLEVKKILTYNNKVDKIDDIYTKILERKPFTVKGYQVRVKYKQNKKEQKQDLLIYTLNKNTFNEALEQMVKTYVGSEKYENYMDKSQKKITKTGTIVEDIYVEETRTIKDYQIPVTENVYNDSALLSNLLLFGENNKKKKYKVGIGDTLESIAYSNKINIEELFISNPSIKNENSLLYIGQEVIIGIPMPKIKVVVTEYVVKDQSSKYKTEYQYDPDRVVGDEYISQKGETGVDRLTQRTTRVNGALYNVDPISIEEIKPTINKIVVKGEKVQSGVAIIGDWAWPTNRGYIIMSDYAYRSNPFSGGREFHQGLDIAGTGHGSNVYAANNGTIVEAGWHYSYGNHIIINHNNGYYTLYAHMASLKYYSTGVNVGRGDVIGYVGMTGSATGPHLHYELWKGKPWYGGYHVNPWNLYR